MHDRFGTRVMTSEILAYDFWRWCFVSLADLRKASWASWVYHAIVSLAAGRPCDEDSPIDPRCLPSTLTRQEAYEDTLNEMMRRLRL
jgi:hypothetical protein